MALSIRLSRGGSKKRPYYRIVVADARAPRDGKFIEKIGNYNPLLAKDNDQRVQLDAERAKHWLANGAQPTDRVARFHHQNQVLIFDPVLDTGLNVFEQLVLPLIAFKSLLSNLMALIIRFPYFK